MTTEAGASAVDGGGRQAPKDFRGGLRRALALRERRRLWPEIVLVLLVGVVLPLSWALSSFLPMIGLDTMTELHVRAIVHSQSGEMPPYEYEAYGFASESDMRDAIREAQGAQTMIGMLALLGSSAWVVAVVLLVCRHSRVRAVRGVREVGIRFDKLARDLGIGVLAAVAAMMVTMSLHYAIVYIAEQTGLSRRLWFYSAYSWEHQRFVGAIGLLVGGVALLANSVAEELVCRAYLISRLQRVGLRQVHALLVSSALFASYHIYYGVGGVIDIFAFGLVMGVVFMWTGRLLPVVIAHTLYNFALFAFVAWFPDAIAAWSGP